MKTLLLLHGAIGAKDQLQPLAEALKGSFEVHTLNFSGHGGEPFSEAFTIQQFADEVLQYILDHQLKNVHVFGYSMGGYVALFLANKQLHTFEKIFTLATKFRWSPEIALQEVKMLDSKIIEERIPAFAKTLQERHAPNCWKLLMEKTSSMILGMGENPPLTAKDFQNIHSPVNLAIGNADKMVSIDETSEAANWLPNSRFLILQDTPHPIEKVPVERLAEVIKKFMN
ncbi:MAG: alpha/beta fold hydrolase [Flavobacteriaceae bacterium]